MLVSLTFADDAYSIGILSERCRAKSESWRNLGFVPPLNPPGNTTSDVGAEYKQQFYQDVLTEILKPLKEAHQSGFLLYLQGKMHYFVPEVCLIVQDSQEVRASCYENF
jgi:hypothetical protein